VKNITISVPDQVCRRARVRAAARDTSVSALVRGALDLSRRHRLSYWDAAIAEAARLAGGEALLSEDLAQGRSYDGVRVANPFRR
jgi:predicted nucleic acid-binding protein